MLNKIALMGFVLMIVCSGCEPDNGGKQNNSTINNTNNNTNNSSNNANNTNNNTNNSSNNANNTNNNSQLCGNGVLDSGEECDGALLGSASCETLNFTAGSLSCDSSCRYDTSNCTKCGNGLLENGEECDGDELNSKQCSDFGYLGGTLLCSSSCTFDKSGCTNDDVTVICQRWNDDVSSAQAGQWTGDINSCDAGDYLSPGRQNALKLTNLYRWLAGLSPVTENVTYSDKAQKCALIQHARGGLTHFPNENDPCYTQDGAEAAQHSNIATSEAVSAVHMYMSDFGNENTMGHRRWILSTWTSQMGFGSTSSYSCQWVINGMGGAGPDWVAFPSPGVFPYQAMNMSWRSIDETGWTIQSDSLRVGEATITVSEDGVQKPINVYNITGGNYGSYYAVRFTPDGWSSQPGHTYHVEVTGISQPFSYDVIMVDCSQY